MISAFAAKADNESSTHVRTLSEVAESISDALKVDWQLAAPLMVKVTDGALNLTADSLTNIISTDDAGNDSDKIAGAKASVSTAITPERILTHVIH